MAVNSNTWSDLFTKKFCDYSGYVLTLDEAVKVLKAYGVATTSTFTVVKQTKGGGLWGALNTATPQKKINKHRIIARKFDETPSPHYIFSYLLMKTAWDWKLKRIKD